MRERTARGGGVRIKEKNKGSGEMDEVVDNRENHPGRNYGSILTTIRTSLTCRSVSRNTCSLGQTGPCISFHCSISLSSPRLPSGW